MSKAEIIDIEQAVDRLEQEVPNYRVPVVDLIAVQSQDPYKVLVATILSARTRDETTAGAAARLFARAPDLDTLARLSEEELAKLIRPVGFFRAKAGYLARLPAALTAKFRGKIPATVEELVQLPGVGRKTANLVVAVAFERPAICVDTHVHRIMNIWGYVNTTTPEATEKALRAKLPQPYWRRINSLLVAFGQEICRPVGPHCDRCPLAQLCPRLGVRPRKPPAPRPPMSAAPGGTSLRLASWNVNGLRAIAKKGFAELAGELDADLLAIQEIKAHPDQLPAEARALPGYQAFWLPAKRKGYSGVAIYSRLEPLKVLYGMGQEEKYEQEGRVLTMEFADFFLVNAYLPNAQPELARLPFKLDFCRHFQQFCENLATQKNVVVCGDLNVAHREIDLARPQENQQSPGFSPAERAWLDGFLANGFTDTFRLFNQEGGNYTWWSYRGGARQRNVGWRIDYFCIDSAGRRRVREAGIRPEIMGSDHCPVTLTLG
ncbi:exodeoxyribonuclease III [Desulfurivibrio alkaliphilus]|uniref:Endonuclease III n=1 Tax=Desulfurivibrio alkaliphilus (strain DSM 19089 / UNIQEM U267 / AHT2) TaxID=589865 RepID=D6Z3S3_DESAT|nr:exodeoxyribonuclease III [Desulfurivibrio alkaliphilus]ADH86198.1 exodeoxyribonuclease III Xth [Desulfurivibrio alkaliphilus AHT 2]